ncbi:MAG TPA: peptidoglycan-binding protein [Bacillota bacterium]|nr:peptidoglycan-binding protein [Bacillota bacterium]
MTGYARNLRLLVWALGCILLSAGICAASEVPSVVLRQGDRGEFVCELQEYLAIAGYMDSAADGIFGSVTQQAVVAFQKSAGLTGDGIVGRKTWDALLSKAEAASARTYVVVAGDTLYGIARQFGVSVEAIASASGISRPESIKPGQKIVIPSSSGDASRAASSRSGAELLHWDVANRILKTRATIIDVVTGLSFEVQRRGGHNHADIEPLTSADTAVLRRIYGGAWSWTRRAVIVVTGGRRIAASINGQPHGGQAITGNGCSGHICLHFLGSRTHASNSLDADHQRMVQAAVGH